MRNYYKGSRENPYHVSVGAVILNDADEVCCHFFKKISLKLFEGITDFCILMRETIEMGETIEETLHRGLMEEFGITAEIITYIGSLKGSFEVKTSQPYSIEKTTLYFLVRMKTFNPELRSQQDVEKESEIQWHQIDSLISKMKEQRIRIGSDTLDESEILESVKRCMDKLTNAK